MQKLSVKYQISSYGYTTNVIVYKNKFEISPYNYNADDILGHEISPKKLHNFMKHLEQVAKLKL